MAVSTTSSIECAFARHYCQWTAAGDNYPLMPIRLGKDWSKYAVMRILDAIRKPKQPLSILVNSINRTAAARAVSGERLV